MSQIVSPSLPALCVNTVMKLSNQFHPILAPGKKEHIVLAQDETKISTNEGPHHVWLKGDQQPLKNKGNRWGMHVSNWICETAGHLALSPKRVASKLQLPKQSCLQTTDACKIIYPGKNHNAWWDLNQLHDQMVDAADFFEYLHLDKVGIWIFDCSSAHEGLAADVLNVNNMNVNPRGKQNYCIPL